MTPATRQCYTCQHYRQVKEKQVTRNAKNEKTGVREVYVDRCAARKMTELRVPVVIGTTIQLMLRAEFEKLQEDAKANKSEVPFIYGSEASYIEGSTMPNGRCVLIECHTFEYQERNLGYATKVRNKD